MSQYKNVATLIGSPQNIPLTEAELNSVVDILQANGAIVENVDWLAENEACDIFFEVLQLDDVRELLEHLFEQTQLPFDFIVQNTENRKKKLIISDMDSTIIEQECIDEIADFAGIKDEISKITQRAMNGEIDFKDALKERVAMLEGLSEDVLNQAFEEKITIMAGAKELVQTMTANGASAILVSGGFTFFTQKIAQIVGFDAQEANILEIKNKILTGKVQLPILDSQAKLNALDYYAQEAGISLSQTLAVGDGANDLPMILESSNHDGLGVAYHAKPNVRKKAQHKIDNCNLKALLYAQGYKAIEITGS